MTKLDRIKVIWAKIASYRRASNPLLPITAELVIDCAPDTTDSFYEAALLMSRIFGWKSLFLHDTVSIEDALLYLFEDLKAPIWILTKRWLASHLSRLSADPTQRVNPGRHDNVAYLTKDEAREWKDRPVKQPSRVYLQPNEPQNSHQSRVSQQY